MNKRTKALQISIKTKQKVWIRQKGRSVISGVPITVNECCCHFIPRSRGGLGIEENVVGMTYQEHMIFDLNLPGDHNVEHQIYRKKARDHLIKNYSDWNEEKLIYKKY